MRMKRPRKLQSAKLGIFDREGFVNGAKGNAAATVRAGEVASHQRESEKQGYCVLIRMRGESLEESREHMLHSMLQIQGYYVGPRASHRKFERDFREAVLWTILV